MPKIVPELPLAQSCVLASRPSFPATPEAPMPQTDGGFQGLRPLAHGPTWDAMTSLGRRRAFLSDVLVAILGAALIYLIFS
jgi:hypothetical protein